MNVLKKLYEDRKAAKQAKKDAEKSQHKEKKQLESRADLEARTRKPEVITAEYVQCCKVAGDMQYRREIIKQELDQVNQKIFQLNQENLQAKKVWGTAKRELAPKPVDEFNAPSIETQPQEESHEAVPTA